MSPDGHWLATLAAPLPGVEIWDATKASLFTNLTVRGHADCQFSPDGQFLLTGTSMAYELWSVAGWKTVTNWPANLNGRATGRVFFSPSGDCVAVEQDRGRLEIRDTHDYGELVTLEPPRPIEIASVAWSPDGRQLFVLSARHRLYAWNLAKLREELAALGLDWKGDAAALTFRSSGLEPSKSR